MRKLLSPLDAVSCSGKRLCDAYLGSECSATPMASATVAQEEICEMSPSDLLKIVDKWKVPTILVLGGLAVLYLAFFASLPTSDNNWTFVLRPSASWPLLALGVGLLATSVGLFIAMDRELAENASTDVTLAIDFEEPNEHPAVKAYHRLKPTQQELIIFRYDDCSTEVALNLDYFFARFVQKHDRALVANVDEMYYRLKELEHVGLLNLVGVAPKVTEIGKIASVSRALARARVIVTSV